MSHKLKFCGAARTVTGSSHLLTTETGFKVLLDCGLYQGNEDEMENFNREWGFSPAEIDVLILSHAHIDHSGRIPRLVKDGFRGDIVCTSATRDLAAIMLMDSASIQERDAEYINRKREAKGYPPVEPLYTSKDATRALQAFIGISYERWFHLNDELSVMFRDAGHILGSASVTVRIRKAGGKDLTLGFTGDIGRPQRPILRDPVPMDPCDYLICESTYGGRHHPDLPDDEKTLMAIINEICIENQSKLLIPAFSVGRTQEIIYMLDRLESRGKLPRIPVYVDSPLAVNATEIFLMHPECYDEDILQYMSKDPNPFGFNGLNYVREVEQSIAINDLKGPAIIVSASGMMQAGRIRHHIRNNIEDPGAGLLIVGYCAPGTLGARLRDGDEEISLFGREYQVKAKVFKMDSFSAHGDEEEMLDFLQSQDKGKLKKIFLVHGDEEAQEHFAQSLKEKGYGKIERPVLFQEYNLEI